MVDSTIDIRPGVGILGVFGHLNYEPWFALAEYVDNALQSAAKNYVRLERLQPDYKLHVRIDYERSDGGRITIDDNAGGIARSDFSRAFRAAEIPPDRTGLSEFGMGMKSASIWFAKNWRVVTSSPGDPTVYTVQFDMANVVENQVERLEVTEAPAPIDAHYTRIELWNLNQFLHARTLGKVRDHLREIYRSYLRADRLILTVSGQNMEYKDPEILEAPDYRHDESSGGEADSIQWRKPVKFDLDESVHVEGWAAIRAEGRTNGNGFALFRRGRVIVGTSDAPFRPASLFGGTNSYRSQRLFGELSIEGLPVSHTKDGFQWHGLEDRFEELLRVILDDEPMPLLKQAEGYRARQASRAEQQRIRQAADNTADVAQRSIPTALDQVADVAASTSRDVQLTDDSSLTDEVFSRSFEFSHAGTEWMVTISAIANAAESRWLIRQIDPDATASSMRVVLVVNAAHPFVSQFALGSTDALESVFRIAVALVVCESLMVIEGDGESAARFMRQVDTLLGSALSRRFRSEA